MKKLGLKIIGLFVLIFFSIIFFCMGSSWQDSPVKTVESIKSDVQNTKFNDASGDGIKETLSSVSNMSGGYVDWIVYIGLSLAGLFIIYNGFKLVLSPLKDGMWQKVKTQMFYLGAGVVVLTGFYFIIKMVLAVVGGVGG